MKSSVSKFRYAPDTASCSRGTVSPKEIDAQIEDLSRLIAGALNTSLQPGIEIGEFGLYS